MTTKPRRDWRGSAAHVKERGGMARDINRYEGGPSVLLLVETFRRATSAVSEAVLRASSNH